MKRCSTCHYWIISNIDGKRYCGNWIRTQKYHTKGNDTCRQWTEPVEPITAIYHDQGMQLQIVLK